MVYMRKEKKSYWSQQKVETKKVWAIRTIKNINDNSYIVDLSSDMIMSKMFNVANLHEYYTTKKLYPNDNLRTSSFKEGGTDIRDQEKKG